MTGLAGACFGGGGRIVTGTKHVMQTERATLGLFAARTGQSERLTAPLRDEARRRLDLLHPDRDQALAIAAERLALPEAALRDALNSGGDTRPPRPRDRQQWADRVAILQTLRSRL